MKQNKFNKGGRNNFGTKFRGPKLNSKKAEPKNEIIEESLDQRLNRVIEKEKAISELIIGYIPHTIKFTSQTFEGITNKPEKISAFEKAVVGIISIDGQTSLANIGKILGLDIVHDIAEQKMIRNAIDAMIRYNLVKGDESAYFITEQGKEFAAHGERMRSFKSDFELWYLNTNHSFADLRDCISSDDIKLINKSEFLNDDEELSPLNLDEIKEIAEIQASNMQSSKERFILQSATPKNQNFYTYDITVCFVQSIRTKEIRAIVYDDYQQKAIPQLAKLIESAPEFKQSLFAKMLQNACENEDLAIYDNIDKAKSDPLINEDKDNILSAERKLIEQEDKASNSGDSESSEQMSNPEDLSERLHKRALYDSITFESELHNIFRVDNPDEIWLSSPWVGDGTFMRNRLPLIKNYLKQGGKVFVSYSAPDGGLDSHKDKMVGDQSQKALLSLESEFPKQFYHVELPAFHKKNVIEVKNGQCVLFTGSFNVLSFSVTAKNITHVRAEEMCLAHYQAAINQYNISKKQFAEIYIKKALDEIGKLTSKDVLSYNNEKIEYFKRDVNLEELFIDYDNALEERKAQANVDLLIDELKSIKEEIDSKISKEGLSSKEVSSYRAKLYKMSSIGDSSIMDEEYQSLIISLQETINKASSTPKLKVESSTTSDSDRKSASSQAVENALTKSISFYNLTPNDASTFNMHIAGLYYLSLFDNAQKANVGNSWKEKLVSTLMNDDYRQYYQYNVLNNKEDSTKRIFIAINGVLYTFYGIALDRNAMQKLLPGKSYLDKNSFTDPFKIIARILFSF